MNLPSNQCTTHAERQRYLVPETDWQLLVRPVVVVDPPRPELEGQSTSVDETKKISRATEDSAARGAEVPGRSPIQKSPNVPAAGQTERAKVESDPAGKSPLSSPQGSGGKPPDAGTVAPPSPTTGEDGSPGRKPRRESWEPPDEGELYNGPMRFRSPRGSNDRLVHRLGNTPHRKESQEYMQGPPTDPEPKPDPDEGPLPTRIKTILYAVNLEYGFLRFARGDFRIFEPACPSRIELVADDDQECIKVAVDYNKGIIHGDRLTEFLEYQAWQCGKILWLEATSNPFVCIFAPRLVRSRCLSERSSISISAMMGSRWCRPHTPSRSWWRWTKTSTARSVVGRTDTRTMPSSPRRVMGS
jgi:hypothetical protein